MIINDSFVLRKIYGRVILVPFRTNDSSNDPILLNDVAADIWEGATDDISREDLLESIANLYGLKKDSVEIAAVDDFISNMLHMGLLLEKEETRNV